MIEISKKSNLLEQPSYKYSLQDIAEPNLYRDMYNYSEVPKVVFNHRRVPMNMPGGYLDYRYLFQRRTAIHGAVHGRANCRFI